MQAALNSIYSRPPPKPRMPTYNGHPDYDLANALKKVSPQAQAKAKTQRPISRRCSSIRCSRR